MVGKVRRSGALAGIGNAVQDRASFAVGQVHLNKLVIASKAFVILSEAKDLILTGRARHEVLRFAQDDNFGPGQ